MNHLYNVTADLPPCTDVTKITCLPDIAMKGKELLHKLYKVGVKFILSLHHEVAQGRSSDIIILP